MTNHTTLHINCSADDKSAWILSARASGVKFEDWVIATLNSAAINTTPEWAKSLSERATICLLSSGFNSRQSVMEAIGGGFNIASISNAGNSIKNEVLAWLDK